MKSGVRSTPSASSEPGLNEQDLIEPGRIEPLTASAEIDLEAYRANLAALRAQVGSAELMVVVKADGYGHGALSCAAAARAAGVGWVGVATPGEALALRAAGDTGRVLAWLYGPADDLRTAVAADVDLAAHHPSQLAQLIAAASGTGHLPRLHLKIDTGLSRNGCRPELWPQLCREAASAQRDGLVEVVSVWSHLACADEPDHPSVGRQLDAFAEAEAVARGAGLRPPLRHLANSAGAMIIPESRLDLVRVGIASYGIEPGPGIARLAGMTLRPVMRLRAQLVNVKRLEAGDAVSYGHTWQADRPTVVGVVPLGYGDGIPRHAGNRAEVGWRGRRAPVRGRICMDQFVVDLGPDATAAIGEEVVLFGSGENGEPTAAQWAEWCGTIGYEIVTRIGPRVPRVPRDSHRDSHRDSQRGSHRDSQRDSHRGRPSTQESP